ncbi:MAG: hypothetical protein COB39_09965 [Marinosulfonomonas sp.]|nr:hypothetical protein [Marinosulfonomonas sp.]PHQ97679.1 MAG: hypothetical protein COB39_09965 [Marinosulfonomonas sp.]
MLKKLFRFANEDNGNIAVDWVVLVAGAVSLGMAVTLTATHEAKAATPQTFAPVIIVATAY